MFPLFASLCLILHPMKSTVEMISQNLQDQGYFLQEKVYFRNMDMCIFYLPGLEDAVTISQSLGPALQSWEQPKAGNGN